MTYLVKEIFHTLQGEGYNSGTAAVFCRFTGCNLWTGREQHRSSAACQFCDTDFVGTDGPGGGRYSTADDLVDAIDLAWAPTTHRRFVVCTGGEPLLQVDAPAIHALRERAYRVAIETNGTVAVPPHVDWTCVSPKAGTTLVATRGDELKLVFPQPGLPPESLSHLQFDHFFLSPMDGPHRDRHTAMAVDYCKANPQWRLTIQAHKYIGIP